MNIKSEKIVNDIDSDIEALDLWPFVNQLFKDNRYGMALFDAHTFTLLKANAKYLGMVELTSDCIGLPLREIMTDFEGSEAEKKWQNLVHTGETLYLEEFKGIIGGMKGKYWENVITPVKIAGQVEFIVSMLIDITEKMINRVKIAEQNSLLEAILENMKEAICVFDKDGKSILKNKAWKEQINQDMLTAEQLNDGVECYDKNGERICRDTAPVNHVLQGRVVEDELIHLTEDGKEYYLNVSGYPMLDQEGKLKYGQMICRDVTEKVKYIEAIKKHQEQIILSEREKNDALEHAIKVKDEFLYLITHEFKTPLVVIDTVMQAVKLMYGDKVNNTQDKYINIIKQNTNRQLRLVNNLLDITRIKTGQFKLNYGAFDIVYIAEAIVSSIQPYAQHKGVRLTFISDIKEKEIIIDEEKFERILLNLISNAIKFTSYGKSITITLHEKKYRNRRMLGISVQDEGIGISPSKQKSIFERFGKADTNLSRQAEGTGIGLYLVKLIVDVMDGHITLKSRVGKGSTFTVTLPLVKALPIKETTFCNTPGIKMTEADSRIIQAVAVEFSNIYIS